MCFAFQLLRVLVAPTNSASATTAAQAGIRRHALATPLLALGFSAACPPVLFAGVFAALGDVTRGCNESQQQLFATPGPNPSIDTMATLLCVGCLSFHLTCFQPFLLWFFPLSKDGAVGRETAVSCPLRGTLLLSGHVSSQPGLATARYQFNLAFHGNSGLSSSPKNKNKKYIYALKN
jgi:hypothetical protein